MKTKLKYYLCLTMTSLGIYCSQGQNLRIAFLDNPTEKIISLWDINTLTFSDTNEDININQTSKTDIYSLSNIKKIYFDKDISLTAVTTSVEKDISLFNNTSESKIEITSSLSSPISLEIYDMNGKKIHEQVITEGGTTLDISNYSQGLYLIKANYSTFKILKQ